MSYLESKIQNKIKGNPAASVYIKMSLLCLVVIGLAFGIKFSCAELVKFSKSAPIEEQDLKQFEISEANYYNKEAVESKEDLRRHKGRMSATNYSNDSAKIDSAFKDKISLMCSHSDSLYRANRRLQ